MFSGVKWRTVYNVSMFFWVLFSIERLMNRYRLLAAQKKTAVQQRKKMNEAALKKQQAAVLEHRPQDGSPRSQPLRYNQAAAGEPAPQDGFPRSRPPREFRGPGVGGRTFGSIATRVSVASAVADSDRPDDWDDWDMIDHILGWLSTWGGAVALFDSVLWGGILCFGAADKASGPSTLLCVYPLARLLAIQAIISPLCRCCAGACDV